MGEPIRVLIADDSVVVRRLLSDILSADPGITIVGAAANGKLALVKLAQTSPDLVILDVEMPEMDGLETLTEIRRLHPRLPVIMFSTLTERGASVTLEALALGATDYVTKPSNTGSLAESRQRVADELIPRIIQLVGRRRPVSPALAKAAPPVVRAPMPAPPKRRGPAEPVDVLAIGVSTGGPNALASLLPMLPADLPVPVLIVQHMPPVFTRLLAERLDRQSAIRVCEAQDGMVVEPGRVYIAPGDHHLTVVNERGRVVVRLNQGPQEQSCRPAVDPLFRSVAEAYGAHTLAVVLTGMGADGMRGATRIAEVGGVILAQDEASSVVWGMPAAVVQAGLAEAVLPLDRIADAVLSRISAGARAGKGVA